MTPDAALEDKLDQQFDVVVCPGGLGGATAMAKVITQFIRLLRNN